MGQVHPQRIAGELDVRSMFVPVESYKLDKFQRTLEHHRQDQGLPQIVGSKPRAVLVEGVAHYT